MQPNSHTTPEAYLKLDAASDIKHEYWDGQVIAMAGAEPEHNKITANLTYELIARLRSRSCSVVGGDQRVQVESRYVYPDVVVTCSEEIYTDTRPRTLVNPDLIIEVLSESTGEQDRGDKLVAYMRMASLQEYWLVEPDRPLVLQYLRRAEEWVLHAVLGLESTVQSEHFGIEIPMRDIYMLVLPEESN